MKRVAWVMTIYLLLTSVAFAQSVDGDWTTSLRARDGQIITLTLKSDGSTLTGTLFGFRTIPLEGSIEGNALKIKLKVRPLEGSSLKTTPPPSKETSSSSLTSLNIGGFPHSVLPPRNLRRSALNRSLGSKAASGARTVVQYSDSFCVLPSQRMLTIAAAAAAVKPPNHSSR